ncbi:MAG: BrnT family toxin [Magnetococcales bacterium]|nr:BrnT family toxin [Magnetococcales bacterium]
MPPPRDIDKERVNFEKHGIHLSTAAAVLNDDMSLTREDEDSIGEQRFVTLGLDMLGRVLVVVWTYRGSGVRLISARKATRKEQEKYYEG